MVLLRVSLASFLLCLGCGPSADEDTATGDAAGSSGTTGVSTSSESGQGTVSTATTTTTAGGEATTDPTTPTTGGESTAGGSTSTGGESSTGVPFDPDCEARCSDLIDGSCLGRPGGCVLTCEEVVGNQGEAVAEAFEACVETQPLCFSRLPDCMWSELYGDEAVEQTFTLQGTGFDAWEGRTVYTRLRSLDSTVDGADGVVEDGAFTSDAEVTAVFDVFNNPRTFYYFVDTDDDGVCTGADYVQSVSVHELGTDFSAPVFVAEATAESLSNELVCDQF